MNILDPLWAILSVVALLGGSLLILAPKLLVQANKQLSKTLVSADELILRHRHILGVLLLIVGYLCFHIAILVKALPVTM